LCTSEARGARLLAVILGNINCQKVFVRNHPTGDFGVQFLGHVGGGCGLLVKLAEIKARAPIVRFGERLPGAGVGEQTSHAVAVRKAEQHADTIPAAAWKLTSFGSRQGFVSAFSERATKVDPATALREFDVK